MGTGRITVAGIQLAGLKGEKTRNQDRAEMLIREAAAQGAQIVMTPEVVTTGFVGGDDERRMAETIPGPTIERFADLAKELSIYVLIGLSQCVEGEIMNAMAVVNPDGELMGVMHKVHINKYETPGGWRNGSEFPVWEFQTSTGQMTAGIMICYDREVPESARLLMLQGADLIFNPLACGCPTSDIHRCLLRTRAFENESYILVVNHAAPRHNGHSLAIDYNGDIVDELDETEGIMLWEIDLDALNKHREHGIYGPHHRRPELYGKLTDPAGQVHPDTVNLPL